jgi:hypothetical protein
MNYPTWYSLRSFITISSYVYMSAEAVSGFAVDELIVPVVLHMANRLSNKSELKSDVFLS